MAKVILFYSPFVHRSRDTETLMIAFQQQGHRVISLSQESGLYINEFLDSRSIENYTHVLEGKRNTLYFLKQLLFFIRFCRKHRVDIVYSHLESANYVASMGQYFIPATVFLCRHHLDAAAYHGFDKSLYYRLTYGLARKIIVVSESTKAYMVKTEKVSANKILHINLAYDFSFYTPVSETNVKKIRFDYPSEILLVGAGRLSKLKRTMQSVEVLKGLRQQGLNARLLLLGNGEAEAEIKQYLNENNLAGFVVMTGYVSAILDYLAAADFLLHPSVSESSCVVVKEAGLTETPVICCKGVGDFDAYIRNNDNGFLVSTEDFVKESIDLIVDNFRNKDTLKQMGVRLKEDVFRLFSIQNVLPQYDELNS